MRTILLLVHKDLRLLARDPLGLVVTFGLPFAFALLFGLLFADEEGPRGVLRVAVVDDARSEDSRGYVRSLEESPELKVAMHELAGAQEALRRADVPVYVHFQPATDGLPSVDVVHGPGRRIEASVVQGALLRAVGGIEAAFLPFTLHTQSAELTARTQGPFDASLPLGMVWGIVCCASIFGVSLVVERQKRTLERLCTAPLSSLHLLASKAIACGLSIALVEVALLVTFMLAFDVQVESPLWFGLSALCTGIGFGGLMLSLSVLAPTERAATGIGWGVLTLLAMVGGGTVPLSQMPPWLERLSHLSPFSWAVLSTEGALWRGFSLAEMAAPCALLVAMGLFFFAAGALAFREA